MLTERVTVTTGSFWASNMGAWWERTRTNCDPTLLRKTRRKAEILNLTSSSGSVRDVLVDLRQMLQMAALQIKPPSFCWAIHNTEEAIGGHILALGLLWHDSSLHFWQAVIASLIKMARRARPEELSVVSSRRLKGWPSQERLSGWGDEPISRIWSSRFDPSTP